MILPSSDIFLTYFVLNAKKTPVFPFLTPKNSFSQSMSGMPNSNGTIACMASEHHKFYQPGHGRRLTVFSNRGYELEGEARYLATSYGGLASKDEESFDTRVSAEMPKFQVSNSLVMILQEAPYVSALLLVKDVEMRMYGLYSEECSLLVMTNLQNYEQLLASVDRESWWIHRFRSVDQASFTILPRRLCSRWERWNREARMFDLGKRFNALERRILRGSS